MSFCGIFCPSLGLLVRKVWSKKKCERVVFLRRRQPIDKSLYLHCTLVLKINYIRYLGVTLDPKLNWNKHVDNVAAKGNSTLGFIRRNLLINSEAVKSKTYKQLVRPVLEYSSTAWDSASDTAASLLEAVQRRSARLIWGIRRTDRKTSTTGFLQKLDLNSLSERRSEKRLKVFRQYHHSSKTAINNYV